MTPVFSDSLKSGKNTEEEVCTLIKKKYPSAYVVEGYCKEHDIVIPEIQKTVEVKRDEKSHFTGNYVVEIEFNGEPSALSTTKSDWWVFVDKARYVWITPDYLRQLVNSYKPVKFIGEGDTKEKKAYLIPVTRFTNDPCVVVYERK